MEKLRRYNVNEVNGASVCLSSDVAALEAKAEKADLLAADCMRLVVEKRALEARVKELEKRLEGDNEPCYYCGKPCSSLSGNPGLWPVALCHTDEPGVVKWHHEICVSERLEDLAASRGKLKKAEKALEECGIHQYPCLWAQWHEGRPTADGGYESRFGDKWYQGDDKPPCTCGLDAALADIRKE